ncbi:HalOD1 output domain-containing protein [Halosimplex aquaticum]|uniref:HalOD1 output domain-containing protein n=1 Tax=Halosimplex aquaticum TaxID=3026162 RepID=A0ABD5Y893_9EURY
MYRNQTYVKPAAQEGQRAGDAQTYYVKHDFEGSAELTTTLAHAISDVTGVDVTDTGFTLNDHVDPEAMDRLFKPKDDGSPRINGHLSFTIWGHQVTVYSDGQIAIVPPRQPAQPQQGPQQPQR